MRPGWPTFNIQQELNLSDPAEWLLALAKGEDPRNFLPDRLAIGVVMSIPDYPYSHLTKKEVLGIPIYGITKRNWQHIHPCEMMLAEVPNEVGGKIVTTPLPATAGDYVLVMTAQGMSVSEVKKRCYARLKQLEVPNSPMYRTDIGDRLAKQLPILQRNGFAMNLSY
jgi:phosphoribosylamine--glycine ligase